MFLVCFGVYFKESVNGMGVGDPGSSRPYNAPLELRRANPAFAALLLRRARDEGVLCLF